MGKPGVAGVYTNQRLSLSTLWEGPRKICQGFKPDSGNPTVRDYRGALGTVRHGETVTPSRNRKSGNGNPSPTARRAQFLSRPRGAKGAGHRRLRLSQLATGRAPYFNGRRQPSIGGTSRISREAYVRICERLGVQFPGPTRQEQGPEMALAEDDDMVEALSSD